MPRNRLIEETKAFLATLIDKPRATLAASKAILQAADDHTLEEAVRFELATFARYNREEPYGREGYTAFREKRTPSWKIAS